MPGRDFRRSRNHITGFFYRFSLELQNRFNCLHDIAHITRVLATENERLNIVTRSKHLHKREQKIRNEIYCEKFMTWPLLGLQRYSSLYSLLERLNEYELMQLTTILLEIFDSAAANEFVN